MTPFGDKIVDLLTKKLRFVNFTAAVGYFKGFVNVTESTAANYNVVMHVAMGCGRRKVVGRNKMSCLR
jgi:hypothetical protein